MVWQDVILDTETPQESFQHSSNGVEENVEDEELVNSQDCILHVDVLSDVVKCESKIKLESNAFQD